MQKNGYMSVDFFVPFEPALERERGETTGNEFVGDIHAVWGEGARPWLLGLGAVVSDNCGQ